MNDADTTRTSAARLIGVAHEMDMDAFTGTEDGHEERLVIPVCSRSARGTHRQNRAPVTINKALSSQWSMRLTFVARNQDIVKSIFMTIVNRLPKGIKVSVKSLRA